MTISTKKIAELAHYLSKMFGLKIVQGRPIKTSGLERARDIMLYQNLEAGRAGVREPFNSFVIGDFDRDIEAIKEMNRSYHLSQMKPWRPISEVEPFKRRGDPILIGDSKNRSVRWAVWSEGFWCNGVQSCGGRPVGLNPDVFMEIPEF